MSIRSARSARLEKWEDVLPQALASIRTLVCSATTETPHSRLFRFDRRGSAGFSFLSWLSSGRDAYLKKFVRNKDDPLVTPVSIEQVINPFYARVRFPYGRTDTVSTSSLAPGVGVPPVQDESRMPAIGSQVSEPLDQPVEVDGEQMDINEPNPPNEVSDTNTSEPTGTTGEFDETINSQKSDVRVPSEQVGRRTSCRNSKQTQFYGSTVGSSEINGKREDDEIVWSYE